jgi:predicted phage terminase large subunit-like protein
MARDKRPTQLPSADCASMTLPEFFAHASGGEFEAPWHLGEYLRLCESMGNPNNALTVEERISAALHVCVSVPPQHAKTTTIVYTIAWLLFRHPEWLFGFGSYAKLYSAERTEDVMRVYTTAGGELMTDHARKADWRTPAGGGCLAFSPDSGISGYKMSHIVFDDFVHDEKALDTEDKRKAIHREIDLTTQRLWPGGSVIAIGTRWHPEDPIGYLVNKGYTEINLPAIREADGVEYALWPEVKPISWLDTKRLPSSKEHVGSYAWETQYQGRPVPPEGSVFGPHRWYSELPSDACVVCIGFDFGYGPEGSSDHSVALVLARDGKGIYYVHDVRRVRATLADMSAEFKALMVQHPYPVRYGCYMGGNEKGILNLLFVDHVAIERMPARHNKHTRAQRCSVAWRAGRVIVREGQPWSGAFVREVEYFTGLERGKDDQVDALVAAFDLVETTAAEGWSGGFTFGSSCM